MIHDAVENDHLAINAMERPDPKVAMVFHIANGLDTIEDTEHQGIDRGDLVQPVGVG